MIKKGITQNSDNNGENKNNNTVSNAIGKNTISSERKSLNKDNPNSESNILDYVSGDSSQSSSSHQFHKDSSDKS